MKVMAIDPGITTGYAIGLIKPGEPMGVVSGQEKWNEFALYEQLRIGRPDILIYEEFESGKDNPYRKRTNYGYDVELFPRNLIGVMNLYVAQINRVTNPSDTGCRLYTQTPSKGLGGTYRNDKSLQTHSVFKVGCPHANDAMRHLLQWYTTGPGFQYQPNREGFIPLA